jgi:hypothetical protein
MVVQEQVLREARGLLRPDFVVHLRHLEVLVELYQQPIQLPAVVVLDHLTATAVRVAVQVQLTMLPLAAVVAMVLVVLLAV